MRHHFIGTRSWYKVLLYSVTFALPIFYFQSGIAQISLGGVDIPYTQDFNTLASGGGTGSIMPANWVFLETGTGSNGTYAIDAGATSTENTYSYGTGSATERALGQINTATFSTKAGASFTNNTGVTITSLLIQYFGEQWRLGALSRTDRIDFQYSTNATAIDNGTWIEFDGLDFTAPIQAGSVGALDGNAAANRTLLSKTITGLSIANSATIWIRWSSFEATGNDDGLSIDDFALTANPSLHYTVANNGVTLSITDTDGNGEGLYVTQQGTSIRFYAPGRTYSLNAGATTALPIDVTIAGLSFIVINAGTGNDTIHVGAFTTNLPGFTINGGIDNDVVNMNGDINFVANTSFNADLQNDAGSPGIDKFNVAAGANLISGGSGIATIRVSHSIVVNSGASIVTANGTLTVEANQQVIPTTGNFIGLTLNNATLQVTGIGIATIKGKGGTTSTSNHGIFISGGGDILGGTSSLSPLTITANGGASTSNANHGLSITGAGSSISSGGTHINITGTGGGTSTSFANYGVHVISSATISSGGTGIVTINGTGGNATGGNNMGVWIGTSGTINSSGGNVNVTGVGGGASGTGTNNYGVHVQGGGKITCGGTGIVNVNGTGGTATGNANDGVSIWDVNSLITSSGGAVNVTGQGGGLTTSGSNFGVHLQTSGMISAGNPGVVTVTGTGGATSGINNSGIFVIENGSAITSGGGNVILNGVGGGSGSSTGNYGIIVFQGLVSAVGAGTVTMTGTGGLSSGANNVGIRVSEVNGTVTSGGGDITLTGIEGSGPDGYAISIYSSSIVTTATNGGNITLIGNSINIAATISTNAAQSISIQQYTDAVDMNLGPATNPIGGPLNLSDAELDFVSTTTLLLGQSATTGTFTITSPITRSALTHIGMYSNEDVIINGGGINTNGGIVVFDAGDSPDAVKAIQAGVDATADIAYPVGDLLINITGTVADVSYTQFNVVGSVNLSLASLSFSGSYDPQPGDVFTIVSNDAADAITGTFIGLAQGATITSFLGSDLPATISYIGGTGNDVVITVGSPNYIITNASGILSLIDFTGNGETLSISQNLTNIRFDVLTRTYSLNGGAVTNFPVDIAIAGLTSITADAAVGNDVINVATFTTSLPSLTLNGGIGDETINFNGDINFIPNASINVDLQNDNVTPGIDQVAFASGAVLVLTANGGATFMVSRSITMAAGSGITTVHGALTVEANQQVTPTAGSFQGINMAANSLIQATGSGVVTVKGKGGNTGGSQRGIENVNGDIIGGTAGTMMIEGIGGATSTAGSNDGIRLFTGGAISSSGAHISITGTAGGTGSTASNIGVNVSNNSTVAASGTGNLTITANGGVATGVNQFGFAMGTGSSITTNSGNIIINGYGGDNSSANSAHGASITGGTITSGGPGTVLLHGEGGAAGTSSDGVNMITSPAKITSNGGTVTVTGIGGGSGSSASCSGVAVLTGAQISAGSSGTVVVQGTGGMGTGASNYGVEVSGTAALITSSGGAVQVTGSAGTLGTITGNNHGVLVENTGKIRATGVGNTTVIGTGGGAGAASNNHGVYVTLAGEISAVGTGTVSVTGTGGLPTGIVNGGVVVSEVNSIITSSGGAVTVTGYGGGSGASTHNFGVYALNGGKITAGATGVVSVNGTGGTSSGNYNYGVVSSINNASITSSGGNVFINGQGGGTGSSGVNIGVEVQQSGTISAGGSGNVIVNGFGGNTSGDSNHGVLVWFDESYITSAGGDVTVTGTGGGGGGSTGNSHGVNVNLGEISATGGGDVTITGYGSLGADDKNYGVLIEGNTALITSGGGPIVITGHSGGSSTSFGINLKDNAAINTVSDGGSVHLVANSMNIDAEISTDPAYFVWLSPITNGMDINLGTIGDVNVGPLNLADYELDSVSTGYLLIGSGTAGDITTTANITRTSSTNVSLQSTDDVLISEGSINTAGGDLSLSSGASPDAVYPLLAGTDVNCGTLYLYGQIEFDIDGLVADVSYTQMNLTGAINLEDASLLLTGSHVPQAGQSFVIINNDGVDAIQNTFVGLAEGATISSFLGGVYPATISYVGGTGNDVVITVASPHYLLSTTGNQIVFTDVAGNGETITMNQSGLNNVQFVVPGRNYSLNGGAIAALPVVADLLGMNTVTINAGVGNDNINVNAFTATMCHLTLNGGVGNDVVTMNGDIVFGTNANLNIDLQNDDLNPGDDRIQFTANTNLPLVALGIATLKCSRSITFNAGSSLTTVNGNLTLEANQQATPTTGTFYGIFLIDNALVEVTGAGTLDVKGKGGTINNAQIGVYVYNSSILRGGSSGNHFISGTGGATTSNDNRGIQVQTSGIITTNGGNLIIYAQGGGTNASAHNHGIHVVQSGVISAGGTGNVTINTYGGLSTGIRNHGIHVYNAGSMITSGGGNVYLFGQSGGSGGSSYNHGVFVEDLATITAGGMGTVTVEGIGGSAQGIRNDGVICYRDGATITSGGGNVIVNGLGGGTGASSYNYGVMLDNGGIITVGGMGDLEVNGTGGATTGTRNVGVIVFLQNSFITSSGGNVTVTGIGGGTDGNAHEGVNVKDGATITAGGNGLVSVTGNGGLTIGGYNNGIHVEGSNASITSSGGDVIVNGLGGGIANSDQNVGVLLDASGKITADGDGDVHVNGTAGQGTNSVHFGVFVSGGQSLIESQNGNVHVTGIGGGASGGNYGVYVYSGARIQSVGSGDVMVEGSGSPADGTDFNHGVLLSSGNASISSAAGDVSVIGFGGGSGATADFNYGVYLFANSNIFCGQGGTLDIQGTGGQGVGFGNVGVGLTTGINHITGGGPVMINGIEGGGATSYGIIFDVDATITTDSLGGNITLVANSILNSGTIETPDSNMVTIQPHTAGVTIHAGGVNEITGGPLKLSDAELDLIHTGHLKIGSLQTDSIKVISDITRIDTLNITLLAGGNIVLDTGAVFMNGGNLLLDCGPSPKAIMPLTHGVEIQTDTLTFGSDLLFNFDGIIPDTQYDQLHLNGVVKLTGVDLKLSGSYSPAFSDTFMIISNDGVDPVIATFNGLAEGASIPMFLGTMLTTTISYMGGDGNDVVIRVAQPHYLITDTDGHLVITDLVGNGETLTVSEVAGNMRFTVAGRNYSYNYNSIASLPLDVSLAGIDSITVNTQGGNDNINVNAFAQQLPGLTINGGTGNDLLTMAGDITFFPGAHFNADMQNDDLSPGVDQVIINSNVDLILSDTGKFTIKVSRNIFCNLSSIIRTQHGNLLLEANQQTIPTAENFSGVNVQGSQLSVTGTGSLIVKGKAGQTNNLNHGVYVLLGGDIIGGTTGAVYIEGVSAQSITQSCHGVIVVNAGSTISSLGADVEVVGESMGAGGNIHNGVELDAGGKILAGGIGNVVVHGTGGKSPGSNNNGVRISAANSSITSSGGNITVTGIGGGNSTSSISAGISILSAGSIIAGGNGTVEVNGTGGFNSGNSNNGISVGGLNSIITSNGGDVIAIGNGGGIGASSNNNGIQVATAAKITAGGTGNVYVEGTGGACEGNFNYGVFVTLSAAAITSSGGNVDVVGQGGGTGISLNNAGVFVGSTGIISAGNLGIVTIEGKGGLTTGAGNNGVHVTTAGSLISSSGGNVNVIGLGGGQTSANTASGVLVETSGVISAGTSGDISIEGQGGSGTGASNLGVSVINGGMINSNDGDIDVLGTAGVNGTSNMIGVNLAIGSINATGTGNVNVEGTAGPGTTANNYGVSITSTFGKITSQDGDITVSGQGGGTGTSSSNAGIYINNGAIESTGNGDISLTGNGGLTTGPGNTGIILNSANALVHTATGDIQITGNGSGLGSSFSQVGIQIINGAEVYAGTVGNVFIQGTGGNNPGIGNGGIQLGGNSTLIRVDQGNLTIFGNAGVNGTSYGYGIEMATSCEIRGSDTGSTLIQGKGSPGTGSYNYGIFMSSSGGLITSQGGNLNIIGIEGSGIEGYGMKIQNNARITTASSGGSIDIKTNSIQCQAGIFTQPADTLTIQPYTPSTDIHLAFGSDILGGPLHLSDQELDSMVTGHLLIGSAIAGDIQIGGSLTRSALTHVDLRSGADILCNPGSLNTNGGNLLIDPGVSPMAFRPVSNGTDVSLDTLSIDGDLAIIINGLLPDVQHHQLKVTGHVDLTGTELALSGSYDPFDTDSFVIISNDLIDMIIGTFNGLAEGDTIFDLLGDTLDATITYAGGDGNDVVIRMIKLCLIPSDVSIAATQDTACIGTSITLSLESGNLGGATDWHWYSNACGTNSEGTGTSIMVTPTDTTTYYVRGEGGCVINDECISKTIVIHPFPDATIYQEFPDSCYFIDRLFRPDSPEIPGATYIWNFGPTAIPTSASGYGPHMVYYTVPGIKNVKLKVLPNADGAQCSDSSSVSFTIYNCPGQIVGDVKSDIGNPIAGVNVRLYTDADTNGMADNGMAIRSVFTTSLGVFAMASLTPGHYILEQTQPAGWISFDDLDTSDDGDVVTNSDSLDNRIPVTIIPREEDEDNKFVERPAPGIITGVVFQDFDLDQSPDANEGLSGITVHLFQDANANGIADSVDPFATVLTAGNGNYAFPDIPVGHYVLVEIQDPGFTSIKDFDSSNDSDVVPNTNMTNDTLPVTVINGETDANNYFIDVPDCGSIVTNTFDDGPGSLRQALACAGVGDTIHFHPILSGMTIEITSDPLMLTTDVVVESMLDPQVILASQIEGMFHIDDDAVVELRGVTVISGLSQGNTGAAFENHGILTLHNTTIIRNPLFNSGEYLIRNHPEAELIFSGECYLEKD